MIQSPSLHRLFCQGFDAALSVPQPPPRTVRSNSHAHASSIAPKSRNRELTLACCFAFANLALHQIIARRELPSTIRQWGRVAESGLRHSTRNRAWGNPPWVRIPPLPLPSQIQTAAEKVTDQSASLIALRQRSSHLHSGSQP